jgi:ubiquinone/menaquinone biosynthesis C-methylase UbiE
VSLIADRVEAHYAHQNLETVVLAALAAAGKDLDHLSPDDLAPIDEFHIRGRKATHELASLLRLDDSLKVLDVGSGLGGASRYLALEFGCQVAGLDLTYEYCQVAAMLCRRLGLDTRVCYCHGNALDMPFADASFDVLWTQHVSMNIADKSRLYEEMWRVLKPGGVLASYEILAGEGGPVYFPVPWARDASASFLVTPQQMLEKLKAVGFETLHWQDTTETGRTWFRRMGERLRAEAPPPLGIHVLLGADFPVMAHNQVRNLEESRVAIIESIVRRPA